MSRGEAIQIIVRAHREGVALSLTADGKLSVKGAQRPSDELIAVLTGHKEEIVALLPWPPSVAPAIEPAKALARRLKALGFRASLDPKTGALAIADTTGRKRNVANYLPIDKVFDTIVAGLADDPTLLEFDDGARGRVKGRIHGQAERSRSRALHRPSQS